MDQTEINQWSRNTFDAIALNHRLTPLYIASVYRALASTEVMQLWLQACADAQGDDAQPPYTQVFTDIFEDMLVKIQSRLNDDPASAIITTVLNTEEVRSGSAVLRKIREDHGFAQDPISVPLVTDALTLLPRPVDIIEITAHLDEQVCSKFGVWATGSHNWWRSALSVSMNRLASALEEQTLKQNEL